MLINWCKCCCHLWEMKINAYRHHWRAVWNHSAKNHIEIQAQLRSLFVWLVGSFVWIANYVGHTVKHIKWSYDALHIYNSISIPISLSFPFHLAKFTFMCSFCISSVWQSGPNTKWIGHSFHSPKNLEMLAFNSNLDTDNLFKRVDMHRKSYNSLFAQNFVLCEFAFVLLVPMAMGSDGKYEMNSHRHRHEYV